MNSVDSLEHVLTGSAVHQRKDDEIIGMDEIAIFAGDRSDRCGGAIEIRQP